MSGTHEGDGRRYAPVAKSRFASLAFAVLAIGAGILTTVALEPVTGAPSYAILVGAVAVTVWYGGFRPGVVAVLLGWALAFVLFVGEDALDTSSEEELVRWGVSLAAAMGVVWVSFVMRRGQERAASAADLAEASVVELANLQELASALSAALTPDDVTHALIARTPAILGAKGGAVGLLDGDELVVADPVSAAGQTHLPGTRFRLTARAPITQAAALGTPIVVHDRATFEEQYPDGAVLTPEAQGAIAVPLRAAGEVVGSMSFLYDHPDGMSEDAEAIARIIADLGGQALERSRLYELERESRHALDQILQIAPRFQADSVEEVAFEICHGARLAFGSDLGVLWRVVDSRLELVSVDPAVEQLQPGLRLDLEDFPRLRSAIETREVSFVPNVQESSHGAGLEVVRSLGIHSSLRTPIAIGDDPALLLVVSWRKVLSDPGPSTILLARRYADQAGLALEQLERRRAEAEATLRADETRRLQAVTAALSLAATTSDVSNVCLEHAVEAVGAEAGFVVLSRAGRVELVTSHGYTDAHLELWRGFDLDGDAPFARAIASGEPVWASSAEDVASFADAAELGEQSWATIPLQSGAGVRGALHLAFRTPRELSDAERRWLQSVVGQCSQALERSWLFDDEQLLRMRTERLQSMTAALSNAITRSDVASVVVDQVSAAAGASGAAAAIVADDRQLVRTLAWRGYPDEVVRPLLEVPADAQTPGNRAIRRRASAFYESLEELEREFPDAARELDVLGHSSYLFVPLVAGRQANGVLVTSWEDPHALPDEERRFIEALAGQAAQALDRASHFESEQTIAETLQRSVLPVSLPRVEGVELAARYLPGTAGLAVGGDWFDAIPLADGRLGLAVGDVVGKGVQAAASMGQLRNALRAFSVDRMKPSSTVARLNRLADEGSETSFATLVYAVIDPVARVCRFASAGHPPPLVLYPDRRAELLEGGRGLPLGTTRDAEYSQDVVELPVGSVLLLYTDGLVERRTHPIDEGLEQLCAAARDAPPQPEQFVEHVLDRMVGDEARGDDIALLAARVFAVAPRPLDLRLPRTLDSLDVIRDAVRAWLVGAPVSGADARDVVLAVWEACANAIEHAERPTEEWISLAGRVSDSTMTLVVEDSGRWVEPSERSDRGLGLRLMHATMSSVDIQSDDGGTRVTLRKTLAAAERDGEPG